MIALLARAGAVAAAFAVAAVVWCSVAVGNAAVGIGPSALAQDTGGSGRARGARFGKMLMSIRPPLSDAQKAQIKQIREQMRAQYRNQGQGQPPSPEERRARMDAFRNKIRGVLNPAQQRDFDAKMAAMRSRRQDGQH